MHGQRSKWVPTASQVECARRRASQQFRGRRWAGRWEGHWRSDRRPPPAFRCCPPPTLACSPQTPACPSPPCPLSVLSETPSLSRDPPLPVRPLESSTSSNKTCWDSPFFAHREEITPMSQLPQRLAHNLRDHLTYCFSGSQKGDPRDQWRRHHPGNRLEMYLLMSHPA